MSGPTTPEVPSAPEAPSAYRRHRVRHRHRKHPAPPFARAAVIALAAILVGIFAWRAVRFFLHRPVPRDPSLQSALDTSDAARRSDFWQHQILESIDAAVEESQLDNITGAEMDVDRATSLLEAARIEARTAAPEFFELAIAALDAALRPHSSSARLTEHVTLTRIELAQFHSSFTGAPGPTPAAVTGASLSPVPPSPEVKTAAEPLPPNSRAKDGHVMLQMPRSIAANHIFNPADAGGEWIDATPMPQRAEIFLPPATRLLVDNVRVRNLTIEGASQTLDGIHWGNVTFVGTRVRYESGEVDLHDVRFEHCTFGFTTDERGARRATAIARGQSSIVIN